MNDDLGNRMKKQYEDRTRYFLPRRTYTIIRIDGKAFHTLTRGMEKPYDKSLMDMMDETAQYLCENIQGTEFAFIQSDEISILLTDFEKITTDAWFDGNIQKMASISASLATAKFNHLFSEFVKIPDQPLAMFDARVFTIPDHIEVENYFIWRQKDAVRNSIFMHAQSLYSHKELEGKSQSDMQELIHLKGQNWNDMPDGFKRGRLIQYMYEIDADFKTEFDMNERGFWRINAAPDFLKDRSELSELIPLNE